MTDRPTAAAPSRVPIFWRIKMLGDAIFYLLLQRLFSGSPLAASLVENPTQWLVHRRQPAARTLFSALFWPFVATPVFLIFVLAPLAVPISFYFPAAPSSIAARFFRHVGFLNGSSALVAWVGFSWMLSAMAFGQAKIASAQAFFDPDRPQSIRLLRHFHSRITAWLSCLFKTPSGRSAFAMGALTFILGFAACFLIDKPFSLSQNWRQMSPLSIFLAISFFLPLAWGVLLAVRDVFGADLQNQKLAAPDIDHPKLKNPRLSVPKTTRLSTPAETSAEFSFFSRLSALLRFFGALLIATAPWVGALAVIGALFLFTFFLASPQTISPSSAKEAWTFLWTTHFVFSAVFLCMGSGFAWTGARAFFNPDEKKTIGLISTELAFIQAAEALKQRWPLKICAKMFVSRLWPFRTQFNHRQERLLWVGLRCFIVVASWSSLAAPSQRALDFQGCVSSRQRFDSWCHLSLAPMRALEALELAGLALFVLALIFFLMFSLRKLARYSWGAFRRLLVLSDKLAAHRLTAIPTAAAESPTPIQKNRHDR